MKVDSRCTSVVRFHGLSRNRPRQFRLTNYSDSFTSINVPFFANFTVFSMEFPITNFLPFFFQTDCNFYQIFLSHTLSRGPNESRIKKNGMPSEIKLFERTEVHFSFYSKEDNFNVNQLKIMSKIYHSITSKTIYLAVLLWAINDP